jgi:O-antigen/teichoic acid export membrane protein
MILNIRRPSALILEAGLNVSFAIVINITLLLILNTENYGMYALGITASSVASLTSVGIQSLVPEYHSGQGKSEDKIFIGLQLQALLVLFYVTILFLIPSSIFVGLTENIGISKLILIASAIYFYSQSADDAIHVLLRISERENLSLQISVTSKLLLLIFAILSSIFFKDGIMVFHVVTFSYFSISLIKILFIILLKSNFILINYSNIKELLHNFFSMWLGNLSNAIFNGIMRIVIGDNFGVKIIGLMTIASQLGSAFAALTSSITLKRVQKASIHSKTSQEFFATFKTARIYSTFAFAFCASTTTVILSYFLYFRSGENFSLASLISVIIPLSVVYSVSVLSVPYYQACQFYGKVKYVSYSNFILAFFGLGLVLLLTYKFNVTILSNLLFMAVGILSAAFIIFMAKYRVTIS